MNDPTLAFLNAAEAFQATALQERLIAAWRHLEHVDRAQVPEDHGYRLSSDRLRSLMTRCEHPEQSVASLIEDQLLEAADLVGELAEMCEVLEEEWMQIPLETQPVNA